MDDRRMKFDPITWFREIWPFHDTRERVIAEYRAAGAQQRLMLADIALRGGVFSTLPRAPGDVFGAGINEGRRMLALEIFELANLAPWEVHTLIARKPPQGETS